MLWSCIKLSHNSESMMRASSRQNFGSCKSKPAFQWRTLGRTAKSKWLHVCSPILVSPPSFGKWTFGPKLICKSKFHLVRNHFFIALSYNLSRLESKTPWQPQCRALTNIANHENPFLLISTREGPDTHGTRWRLMYNTVSLPQGKGILKLHPEYCCLQTPDCMMRRLTRKQPCEILDSFSRFQESTLRNKGRSEELIAIYGMNQLPYGWGFLQIRHQKRPQFLSNFITYPMLSP